MDRRLRLGLVLVAGIVSLAQVQDDSVFTAELLESYLHGDYARAIHMGASSTRSSKVGRGFPRVARKWIDAQPDQLSKRRQAAAGLILEIARDRYERDAAAWQDWRAAVEWSREELGRGPASEGERLWDRASVALAGRLRDRSWLDTQIVHAWRRYPEDPFFWVAKAIVLAEKNGDDRDVNVIAQGARYGMSLGAGVVYTDRVGTRAAAAALRSAIKELEPAQGAPEWGAFAEIHIAYRYLMLQAHSLRNVYVLVRCDRAMAYTAALMRCVGITSAIAVAVPLAASSPQVFRSVAQSVTVDVSVKRGNVAVLGLRAGDFRVLDNGVTQEVAVVTMDAVPIDVSVFLDVSGSTYLQQPEMQRILRDIVRLLRPGDRFRVLVTGLAVRELVGWTEPGAVSEIPQPGTFADVSLVFDGLYAAAAHRPDPGRRHLVVALTDGEDDCSLVQPEELRALAGRTESVVHWIPRGGTSGGATPNRPRAQIAGGRGTCPYPPTADTSPVADLANGTGGEVHDGIKENLTGSIFERILSDYRQSYLLSYTPTGVDSPGWHRLEVSVVNDKYTVRARSGYVMD